MDPKESLGDEPCLERGQSSTNNVNLGPRVNLEIVPRGLHQVAVRGRKRQKFVRRADYDRAIAVRGLLVTMTQGGHRVLQSFEDSLLNAQSNEPCAGTLQGLFDSLPIERLEQIMNGPQIEGRDSMLA